MDSLQIAYRDVDRTPLLYVLREMALTHEDLDLSIEKISGGHEYEQEFLGGNLDVICEHLRFLLPARLKGHPVRCIASCQNMRTDQLLVAKDITKLSDLEGRRIAIRATQSSNMSSLRWIAYLGLQDSVETISVDDEEVGRWRQWEKVVAGEASAVICSQLYMDAALEAGLHVLKVPSQPELGSLFLAGLGPFISANDDKFRSLVRALYRALYVFINQPEKTIEIMSGKPAELMHLESIDAVRTSYKFLVGNYDLHPIPTIDAMKNTFDQLNENYEPLDGLNFLTLWDLRYVIELEESKFMDTLVRDTSSH